MLNIYNKSNTECGIIRPTNAFTWDHIHRAANLAMLKRVLDGFKKSISPSKRVLSIITIIYLLFTYKTTYITQ